MIGQFLVTSQNTEFWLVRLLKLDTFEAFLLAGEGEGGSSFSRWTVLMMLMMFLMFSITIHLNLFIFLTHQRLETEIALLDLDPHLGLNTDKEIIIDDDDDIHM